MRREGRNEERKENLRYIIKRIEEGCSIDDLLSEVKEKIAQIEQMEKAKRAKGKETQSAKK